MATSTAHNIRFPTALEFETLWHTQDMRLATGQRGDRTAPRSLVAIPGNESLYLHNIADTNESLSEVAFARVASFPKAVSQTTSKTNIIFSIDSHSAVAPMTASPTHAPTGCPASPVPPIRFDSSCSHDEIGPSNAPYFHQAEEQSQISNFLPLSPLSAFCSYFAQDAGLDSLQSSRQRQHRCFP